MDYSFLSGGTGTPFVQTQNYGFSGLPLATPQMAPAAPAAPSTTDSGPGTISNAPALQYGQQIMQTAMDPQNALYNRTQQQLTDQIRAGLAARGLNMSGVGQGIEQQGLNNFNIDWQNNLLGRQVQGAGAYTALAGLAQNIANQGFQNWGEYGKSQYTAPQPSMPYGSSMYGSGNDPWGPNGMFTNQVNQDIAANSTSGPTGWSAAGGTYYPPGSPNYNPNFQWG
jgi:hypothetical protein